MKTQLSRALVVIVVLALAAVATPQAASAVDPVAAEAARDMVLDGVGSLSNPTQPGHMVVYGEDAFSIANFGGQDQRRPLVAGAFWGAGRVIAMGDHQFLNMNNYGDDAATDSGKFYLNGIEWLADSASKDLSILVMRSSAVDWLTAQGFTNVVQNKPDLTAADLAGVDVVVGWIGSSASDETVTVLGDFVQTGGGLFLADYGIGYNWWWAGEVYEAPGNRLLRDVGIGFTPPWPGGDLSPSRGIGHIDVDIALDMLANPTAYTVTEHEIGGAILKDIRSVVAPNDPLAARINTAYELLEVTHYPTAATPVTDSFQKAILLHQAEQLSNTPANEVVKHPVAEELYGAVESDARVDTTAPIDLSLPRWQATGLFVAPGEVVTVRVPAEMVGKGYKLRVNAHTDNIQRRDSWERPPVVHRWFPIDAQEVQVANGFGGLLFVDLGKTPAGTGTVTIEIDNAVEAPYFVLGSHTDAEWNATLKHRPAPFTVLVSESMILSVPTRHINDSNLTRPEWLMTWWNDVVIGQDYLTGQIRTSAELANVDRQISAGAAHSGYPYQAYERHWGNMTDVIRLTTTGSWGDFHELGHNHQRGWWTFDGDGEVSVNIMSNYSLETNVAVPSLAGWGYSTDGDALYTRAKADIAAGGTYSSKRNRWSFWFQLADGFGWDAYRSVFEQYEEDNRTDKSLLPGSDAEEKSQWLVRFSKEVGFDMSPFMVDMWGLQVSAEARAQVAHLPGWGPVVADDLALTTSGGNSVTFTPADSVDAMITPIITVDQPSGGMVTDNGDGTFTYDPLPGRDASEQFEYHIATTSGVYASRTITVTNSDIPTAGYVPLNPFRLLDTRPGLQVGEFTSPWTSDLTRSLTVTGNGVPATADAVALHITSVNPTAPHSWLTISPSGETANTTAAHNFGTGPSTRELSNDLVIAKVGANGKIDLRNHAGSVDLVIDVVGFYSQTAGDGYVSLAPSRLVDTRAGLQRGPFDSAWGPGETRSVKVDDAGGVADAEATAVALHITTVSPTAASSWLTVSPTGQAANTTAAHNFGTGAATAALSNNLIIAPIGDNGMVDIRNAHGTTHLVIDVVGYYSPNSFESYHPLTPVRVLDTRNSTEGDHSSPFPAAERRDITLASAGLCAGATAVAMNVTTVSPSAPSSWLTVSGDTSSTTPTASHNFGTGSDTAGLVNDLLIARLDASGNVNIENAHGAVDIVIDVVGYHGDCAPLPPQ